MFDIVLSCDMAFIVVQVSQVCRNEAVRDGTVGCYEMFEDRKLKASVNVL